MSPAAGPWSVAVELSCVLLAILLDRMLRVFAAPLLRPL
jgi:hypothetical protein